MESDQQKLQGHDQTHFKHCLSSKDFKHFKQHSVDEESLLSLTLEQLKERLEQEKLRTSALEQDLEFVSKYTENLKLQTMSSIINACKDVRPSDIVESTL